MKKYWILFLFLCLSTHSFLHAQMLDNVQISRYSGIPAQAKVNDILVDKQNNKWLATNRGIYKMIHFNHPAAKIIEQKEALALALSRNGDVWGGFSNGEIINLETKNTFRLERNQDRINTMAITSGQIWIGTNNGLYIINAKTGNQRNHFTTANSKLKSNNIKFVFFETPSVCWVGTEKGIARINEMNWKYYDKSIDMQAINYNEEGVWLANEKELFVIDSDNRWYPAGMNRGLHQGEIKAITIDTKGNLYLASEVLVRFNPYTEKTERYGEEIGFISNQCLSISTDGSDNVWVGTEDSGLYRLRFSDEEEPIFEELSAVCFVEKAIRCDGKNDGIIKVVSSGGIEPYTYIWNDQALKGDLVENLSPNLYVVTVQDAVENIFTASIELSTPESISIRLVESLGVTRAGKNDGSATIEVSGGISPYEIQWDNGETGFQNSKLSAGAHTVTVRDANDCSASLDLDIEQPKILPDLEISQLEVGQTLQIEQLFFDADSSAITQASTPVLNEIYEFMARNKGIAIEIGGHTNNIPPHEYCDRLSTERARNVANYLYGKGISSIRISYKGYGKRQPIATNQSAAGRRKNQRVELKVLEIK